jgi:toxin ParE1/3/4
VTQPSYWTVLLASSAEVDLRDITAWTLTHFGNRQARAYAETLSAAITALAYGPGIAGVESRKEIGKDLFTLHVARGSRRASHVVLFRLKPAGRQIEVLRVLHDAMDLKRHTPD